MALNKAQLAYMSWLQANHPALYGKVVPNDPGLSGIFDSIANGFKSLVANAGSLFSTYVTSKGQLDLLKANTARAKQGLPPVASLEELAQSNAWSIQAGQPMSFLSGIPPIAWVAGGGLLLFLLLRRK